MKESIKKRIEQINSAETPEDLKKCLCPFFEKGGCPDCIACKKAEADLDDCKDFYLEHIVTHPMDLWCEDFDTVSVQERDTVSLEEVSGIGSNCDNCYIYDKCPLYKKGYSCGIKWDSNRPKTPTEFMDFLINTQYERVRRSAIFEKLDGGVPDAGLSGEMDRLKDLIFSKSEMGRDKLSISVEASSPGAKSGGGILSRIFGGGSLPESKPKEIEARPTMKDAIVIEDAVEVKEPVKVARQRKK